MTGEKAVDKLSDNMTMTSIKELKSHNQSINSSCSSIKTEVDSNEKVNEKGSEQSQHSSFHSQVDGLLLRTKSTSKLTRLFSKSSTLSSPSTSTDSDITKNNKNDKYDASPARRSHTFSFHHRKKDTPHNSPNNSSTGLEIVRNKSKSKSKNKSKLLTPTISSSAPSSRTQSRNDWEGKDHSATVDKHHSLHLPFQRFARSKSVRINSYSDEDTIGGRSLMDINERVSPSKYLPNDLHVSNWSLSSKYSMYKNLIKTRVVGKGATAVVRTVQANNNKREIFAVKIYHKFSNPQIMRAYKNVDDYYHKLASEYIMGKRLKHRNIVSIIDLLLDSTDSWCCVMEYCDFGDLFTLIEAYKTENKRMTKDERNCLFKQLLMGVSYLHNHGIAHRDIKPENLLLTSTGLLKISDFGVSEVLFDSNEQEENRQVKQSKGLNGSEPYISPEVFEAKAKGETYDARLLDIWSCAIVYINLAFNAGIFSKAMKSEDANYSRFVDELDKFWKQEHEMDKYIQSMSEDISEASSSIDGTISTPPLPYAVNANNGNNLEKPLFFFNEFGGSGKKLIARMLSPDVSTRPYINEVISSPMIRHIGMCIGPDPSELKAKSKVDITRIDSVRQMKDQFVKRNHSHKPPPKPTKTYGMGQLKDPYK